MSLYNILLASFAVGYGGLFRSIQSVAQPCLLRRFLTETPALLIAHCSVPPPVPATTALLSVLATSPQLDFPLPGNYNMASCVCLQNIRVIPLFSNFCRDDIGIFVFLNLLPKQ